MDVATNTLPADAAPEIIAEAVARAEHDKARIALTRDGRPVAFIVPVEDAEWLEALEDAEDERLAGQAHAEWVAAGKLRGESLEAFATRHAIDLSTDEA